MRNLKHFKHLFQLRLGQEQRLDQTHLCFLGGRCLRGGEGWGGKQESWVLGPGSDGPGSSGSLPLASSVHLTAGEAYAHTGCLPLRTNGRCQARNSSEIRLWAPHRKERLHDLRISPKITPPETESGCDIRCPHFLHLGPSKLSGEPSWTSSISCILTLAAGKALPFVVAHKQHRLHSDQDVPPASEARARSQLGIRIQRFRSQLCQVLQIA